MSDHNMNCYGDGTVYRGIRSKDSQTPTYTWHDLAHAALVEKCAALETANKDLQDWFDALKTDHDALKEAAKLALDALTNSTPEPMDGDDAYCRSGWKRHADACVALKAVL